MITENPEDPACGCTVDNDPYSEPWYDRIVADTGSHLRVPDDQAAKRKFSTKSKMDLKSMK